MVGSFPPPGGAVSALEVYADLAVVGCSSHMTCKRNSFCPVKPNNNCSHPPWRAEVAQVGPTLFMSRTEAISTAASQGIQAQTY